MKRFCTVLKEKRKKLGYTQKEMAAFLEMPYSTYCQYEQGFNPGSKNLIKILKKLGILNLEGLS